MRKLLAVLVLIAAVGGGCIGGGDARKLIAEFADVGDLVGRSSVQQSDAKVGSVTDIELVQRTGEWVAVVTMKVGPEAKVQEGMTAVVRSTSLLGEKFVDLVPPKTPGRELPDGAVLKSAVTAKAPELEELFSQLGGLLASGGLADLARITSASAMILEGQEDNVGRVLDGTAKLISALHRQRGSLASAVADLASASHTLSDNSKTLDRALGVSDNAVGLLAEQQAKLDTLVVQLDRLGGPLGDLTRAHSQDIDTQVKAINKAVPQLFKARDTLSDAVEKLPDFARLFGRAAPGDYVQLDIVLQTLPFQLAKPAAARSAQTGSSDRGGTTSPPRTPPGATDADSLLGLFREALS